MAAYLKRTASAEMRSAQYRQMGRRRRRRVLLFPLLLGLMLFLGGFMLGAGRTGGGGTDAISGVCGGSPAAGAG